MDNDIPTEFKDEPVKPGKNQLHERELIEARREILKLRSDQKTILKKAAMYLPVSPSKVPVYK